MLVFFSVKFWFYFSSLIFTWLYLLQLKNCIMKKTAMNLINISKHRIYTFYKHLWWTSHGSSHFIIQLITDYFSNERQKFLVLFYGSCSNKPTILLFTLPGCRFFALFAVAMDIFGAIYHETAAVCIYHLQLKMILNISLVHDYYML